MSNRLKVWMSGGVTLLTLFGATGVFAEPSPQLEVEERHCVMVATADATAQQEEATVNVEDGAEQSVKVFLPLVQSNATGAQGDDSNCFSTFSAAIQVATSGAVSLPQEVTPETVTAAMIQAPAATTVIGVLYKDSGYRGGSLTVTVPNSFGCVGFSGFYFIATPPSGWNDTISSAKSFGGCGRVYNYEHASFGGAALVCRPNCSSFGIMNDEASSWRWWASGFHY